MGSSTVAELRHLMARLLGDHTQGIATSGGDSGDNSFRDSTRRHEENDYWNGVYGKLYAGTGAGQERRLTDFVAANGEFISESNWSPVPDNTTEYELHFLFQASEYDAYLLMALRSLAHRGVLLKAVVDETLTWVTDQYDYTVPAGVTAIRRIDKQTTTGSPGSDDFEPLPSEQWEIRRATTQKIVFGKNFSQLSDGQQLRIHGYQEFADPTSDTDTYAVDPFVIAYLAASIAAAALIPNEPTAHWREMEQRLSAMAERYEARERQIFDSGLRYVEGH